MALASIAILRADHPSQYKLSSQTGACSARHSLRPQTTAHVAKTFFTFSLCPTMRSNNSTYLLMRAKLDEHVNPFVSYFTVARFYANYGPKRQIQVNGRYDLLGKLNIKVTNVWLQLLG